MSASAMQDGQNRAKTVLHALLLKLPYSVIPLLSYILFTGTK